MDKDKDKDKDCLFCKIVAETIPARRFHDDVQSIAFADVKPQAPVHLLIIPKRHIVSLGHAAAEHTPLLGHLMSVAANLARAQQLANGYRIVVNIGENGGQTVDHLHLHLLGGRSMAWPPG